MLYGFKELMRLTVAFDLDDRIRAYVQAQDENLGQAKSL